MKQVKVRVVFIEQKCLEGTNIWKRALQRKCRWSEHTAAPPNELKCRRVRRDTLLSSSLNKPQCLLTTTLHNTIWKLSTIQVTFYLVLRWTNITPFYFCWPHNSLLQDKLSGESLGSLQPLKEVPELVKIYDVCRLWGALKDFFVLKWW